MKKLVQLSVLIALFSVYKTNAQITVTNANMPASGDTIRYSNCRPSSINYSSTGANIFWDYDTLVPQGQGIFDYTPAASTPYFFYFLGGDYGLKVSDSIGVATFKLKNIYDFYKNTTGAFETKGIGFEYSGFPLAATYNPVDKIYVFPLNYLDHDSTPYKVTASITTATLSFSYSEFGYRITDVDGWGVIKTPYDSTACLRIVSTTYGKDSINYEGIGFAIPDVQRSYKWVSIYEKIPMLEVDGTYTGGNFAPNKAFYRDGLVRSFAGIKPVADLSNQVSVYPNPTNGDLFICTKSPDVSTINLFDVNGIMVASYKASGIVTKVSTQGLAKGCYYYTVNTTDAKQAVSGKVIVIN